MSASSLARRIEVLEGGPGGGHVDIARVILATRAALAAGTVKPRTVDEMIAGVQALRGRLARRMLRRAR